MHPFVDFSVSIIGFMSITLRNRGYAENAYFFKEYKSIGITVLDKMRFKRYCDL